MSIKQAIEAQAELVDQVCDALIQAWTLGQYYHGYNDRDDQLGAFKAQETHTKFVALLDKARAAVEAALRDAPQAEPVAWHVNFRGSSHLLTSLESVDLTDCIVTPLYPEPRAPDNTLKDRLLAALERAAGAESALRRLADKTEPLTQTRGYHALVQVIYELQQDGNYSDEEGEETSALVELLRAIEATPSAPTAVEPDERATCEWTLEDDDNGTWQSSCGELWSFIEGGPKENRVSFCHNCGKPAIVRASKGTP